MKSLAILICLALYAPQVEASVYETQAVSPPQVGFVRSYARHVKAKINNGIEWGEDKNILPYAWAPIAWGAEWLLSKTIPLIQYVNFGPNFHSDRITNNEILFITGVSALFVLFALGNLMIREAREHEAYAEMMWGKTANWPGRWQVSGAA